MVKICLLPKPGSNLLNLRLLVFVCLLFTAAGITHAQTPTLRIDDNAMYEDDSGSSFLTEFKVSLSSPSSNTVSVLVSTQQGTAISNVDFAAGSATLTFQPGQTSQVINLVTIGDNLGEETEEFLVNLSNPVNATIGDGQALATIIDDDALLLVTQEIPQRATALDSVLLTRETFPIINNLNMSSDHRTRVSVFAVGLKLQQGETASAVTATAEDSTGALRPLTVEFVGKVPNHFWLTQVVVKLNDQIVPGDVKIRITLRGATSNAVLAATKAQ
jgi:Calx-beta domain